MLVQPGVSTTVTATEKWLSAVQAGNAFGGMADIAASAGNVSIAQLYNPVGSPKTVLCRGIIITAQVNVFVDIAMYDTALTTDVGAGINLLDGGAAAQAHIRSQQPAAEVGTPLMRLIAAANLPYTFPLEWFAQLGPANGLVVEARTVNVALTVSFLWLEQ